MKKEKVEFFKMYNLQLFRIVIQMCPIFLTLIGCFRRVLEFEHSRECAITTQ